jgi:hypothetical protein
MPKAHTWLFTARKSLGLLKNDMVIQRFTLEHLFWVWNGGPKPDDEPDEVPAVELGTEIDDTPKITDVVPSTEDDPFRIFDPVPDAGSDMVSAYSVRCPQLGCAKPRTGHASSADATPGRIYCFLGILRELSSMWRQGGHHRSHGRRLSAKNSMDQAHVLQNMSHLRRSLLSHSEGRRVEGFELALNRIGSHSVECHFGITRSMLNGETRWDMFFSAQVKAVIIRRLCKGSGSRHIFDIFGCQQVALFLQTVNTRSVLSVGPHQVCP